MIETLLPNNHHATETLRRSVLKTIFTGGYFNSRIARLFFSRKDLG